MQQKKEKQRAYREESAMRIARNEAEQSSKAQQDDDLFGAARKRQLREALSKARARVEFPTPNASSQSSSASGDVSSACSCAKCGRVGHASNACPSFPLPRGQVDGVCNHPDSGWGDNVPHISETRIRIVADGVEQTAANKAPYWYQNKDLEIEVDGRSYHLGRASGDENNCLIDTLRQALPFCMCSVAAVRSALEVRHRGLPTEIRPGEFLPLDFWDDIVDLLGRYNESGSLRASWAHRFRVVCVDLTWIGSGEVFPRGVASDARATLAIARVNQNHFVPLLPLHSRHPRWMRP